MKLLHTLAAILALSGPLAAPAFAQQPTPENNPGGVLFWSPADRERAFRRMEAFGPHAPIARGETPVRALPPGDPITLDPSAYMAAENVAGVLVIQDGRIRLERYGLGLGERHIEVLGDALGIAVLDFNDWVGTAIARTFQAIILLARHRLFLRPLSLDGVELALRLGHLHRI
jgi:hypothetical protein